VLFAVMLNLMVAVVARAPLALAMTAVAVFAIFHRHAHGVELLRGADAEALSANFVVAMGLLHLSGIGPGPSRWPPGTALPW
jgi:urease accessory protein